MYVRDVSDLPFHTPRISCLPLVVAQRELNGLKIHCSTTMGAIKFREQRTMNKHTPIKSKVSRAN